jgi:hypothetical protein
VKDGSGISKRDEGYQRGAGSGREDLRKEMKRSRWNGGLRTEEKCLTTKGGSTLGWITLTTLISSPLSLSLPTPFLFLPTSSLFVPRLSASLSFTLSKEMVRTETKSEELDIKPFSNTSRPQEMKGTAGGGKWTGEDRKALFIYVEKYGAGNWTAAAGSIPWKTAKQVRLLQPLSPRPSLDEADEIV